MNSRQLGVHLMAWSGRVDAEEMALFPLISEMGYNDEGQVQICGKTSAMLFWLTNHL